MSLCYCLCACGDPPLASACVCTSEMCSFPPSSYADLFMNLGIYCFEVKPGDAVVEEANGDKTPPIGPTGRTAALPVTAVMITTV